MKGDIDEFSGGFKEPFRKKRPLKNVIKDKEDLLLGRVIFVSPESVHVHHNENDYFCSIKGTLKKELKDNKNRLCPGDLVYFDPEKNQIAGLKNRKTYLNRQNPSQKYQEQILAANIDLLLITTSIQEPGLNPYLIDLYIISARYFKLEPIIIINKMDLLSDVELANAKELINQLKDQYQRLKIPILFVSAKTREGFKELESIMKEKASVFSGASGVGKSSLINALEKSSLKVAPVSAKSLKGTHTTTSSKLLKLKLGGFCVDTPGIQSLGFKNFKPIEVRDLFDELSHVGCQFQDCLHLNEKGCKIKEAIEKKEVSLLRLESYHRLLKEIETSR